MRLRTGGMPGVDEAGLRHAAVGSTGGLEPRTAPLHAQMPRSGAAGSSLLRHARIMSGTSAAAHTGLYARSEGRFGKHLRPQRVKTAYSTANKGKLRAFQNKTASELRNLSDSTEVGVGGAGPSNMQSGTIGLQNPPRQLQEGH